MGALLAGVRRIDVHQRHSSPFGLVLDVLAKLEEAPRMQGSPLVLTEPYPASDAREAFQGDTGAGAFSGGDDGLGDDVIDACGVPGFLAGALLQEALGGLGALGLELLPQIELSFPVPVQAAPGSAVAGGGGSDVGNPEVDADEPAGLVLLGLGDIADGDQVEHAVAFDQVALALAVLAEHLERVRGAGEAEVSEPSGRRPDRHSPGVVLPGQAPVVVGLRGLGPERDRLRLCLDPALGPRLAQVPGADVRLQRGVGVTRLLDDVLGGLRPQPARLQLGVGVLPQLVLTRDTTLERHTRYPARGLIDRTQRRRQRGGLVSLRHQLHLRHELHTRDRITTLCHHAGNQTPTSAGVVRSSTPSTPTWSSLLSTGAVRSPRRSFDAARTSCGPSVPTSKPNWSSSTANVITCTCWCTTRPKSPCPGWSAHSSAYPPADS